jgi:integrase
VLTTANSTASRRVRKSTRPKKPRTDFPLFPHATKRWAKKIRGKLHYFGPWNDPEGSLKKYLDQKDDLHAGRTPRVQGDGLTVRDLVNRFLTSKRLLLDSGELAPRTWAVYHETCERLTKAFGLTRLVTDLATDDFERFRAGLAKRWGPAALGNEIQRVRVVFKYAYDAGLIATPIRYGPGFKRPSKKVLREARHAKGPRTLQPHEIRALVQGSLTVGENGPVLVQASVQLRAMILLGINCGFGNADCGTLPIKALDLETGWIDIPRPKTAVQRRCPLWQETVQALREVLAQRKPPKGDNHAGVLFVTKRGVPWAKSKCDNPISNQTAKLLRALGIHRPGLGFYALRHTFETIGGEARDQVAVDAIMGHTRDDMASVYRERISDDRLRSVTETVRRWLFASAANKKLGTGRRQYN